MEQSVNTINVLERLIMEGWPIFQSNDDTRSEMEGKKSSTSDSIDCPHCGKLFADVGDSFNIGSRCGCCGATVTRLEQQ